MQYEKYKNKYLALKNKIGGSNADRERYEIQKAIKESLKGLYEAKLDVGSKINVIPNNGNIEGMSQQCFWISIYNYLERHPDVNNGRVNNVRGLRTLVGLGKDTEHLPFDENDSRFKKALEKLINIFDLQIIVHFINARGEQIILSDQITGRQNEAIRPINESGANLVRITQHGLNHFQYMTGSISSVPKVGEVVVGAGDYGVLVGKTIYFNNKNVENISNKETKIKIYEEFIENLKKAKFKLIKEETEKLNELTLKINNKTEVVSSQSLSSANISFDDIIANINKVIKKYKDLIVSSMEKIKKTNKDDLDPEVLKNIEEHFLALEQIRNRK